MHVQCTHALRYPLGPLYARAYIAEAVIPHRLTSNHPSLRVVLLLLLLFVFFSSYYRYHDYR